MTGVDADPRDLRQFASDLRKAREQIEQLSNGLIKTLGRLSWNDSVKVRVESDVKAAVSGMARFNRQLDEHAKYVDRKAADLERFLGHK